MSGRKLLFVLLVGLLFSVGLLFYLWGDAAWRIWNIPVMSPSFADIRSILLGVEARQLGFDPLYQNPLDPFGRVMAYPRLWLALGALSLSQGSTALLAGVEAILFLFGLFIFLDHFDRTTALLIAALVISPAVMLCFERGNTDLIAFFLIACALALVPTSRLLSIILIEIAALLKLYPAIALGYLIRAPKKSLVVWLSAALLLFGIYAAFTWRDIHQILSVAPKGVGFNYGVSVVGLWIFDLTASRPAANIAFLLSYLLAYLLLLYVLYRSHRDSLDMPASNPRALDAFRVGALIYIGTFLQGNTWNYRLIFLIFAIPQMVEWARKGASSSPPLSRESLVLLMLSAWASLLGAAEPPVFNFAGVFQLLLDELSNWGLLACLVYLLLSSLPAWMREQIALFFDKYGRSSENKQDRFPRTQASKP